MSAVTIGALYFALEVLTLLLVFGLYFIARKSKPSVPAQDRSE